MSSNDQLSKELNVCRIHFLFSCSSYGYNSHDLLPSPIHDIVDKFCQQAALFKAILNLKTNTNGALRKEYRFEINRIWERHFLRVLRNKDGAFRKLTDDYDYQSIPEPNIHNYFKLKHKQKIVILKTYQYVRN
jgi:hypothetical protein